MFSVSEVKYYMDDTSIPYDTEEYSFQRIAKDDDFDREMIHKYNLVTKEKETA